MRLQDYDTSQRHHATVVSNTRITPESSAEEVRELELDLDATGLGIEPGQSIGVLAPGDPAFGQEHHFRLYTVADLPEELEGNRTRIRIAVKRCFYIDPYSGERYPGRASNYLCDRSVGDVIEIAGPYGMPFEVPAEKDANLILIGAGTGIAPFRAFVKHLYHNVPEFTGRVILFHGAHTGVDLLYRNDERDDLAQYYDRDTFEAINALAKRPGWSDAIDWEQAMDPRGAELWKMIEGPWTYVYVAGHEKILDELDQVFSRLAGSPERWERRKAELEAGRRWVELVYA